MFLDMFFDNNLLVMWLLGSLYFIIYSIAEKYHKD